MQNHHALPFSDGRYCLNSKGQLKEDGTLIQIQEINEIRFVELDWFDGKKFYPYDSIVGLVFFKIKIPLKYLHRIELIFSDGDKTNLKIDNLAYRFIGPPIESDQFRGYYYVPYYTNYLVNKSGEVISLKMLNFGKKNCSKKWTISKGQASKNIKGGYRCGRGKRDHDDVDGVSRHRFIALTFIHYPKDPLQMVVNHKNGQPGDDRINNLEWVTYSENTKHAYLNNLHPNKVVPVVFLNENTGTEKRYQSVVECARHEGLTHGLLFARLKKPTVGYSDGFRIKIDDGTKWPPVLIRRSTSDRKAVVVNNVYKNKTLIYSTIAEASEATGITAGAIAYHCLRKVKSPTLGYSFRFLGDELNWPHRSQYHLRMYRRFSTGRIPKGLAFLNSKGSIVEFFETVEDFKQSKNINDGCLNLILKGALLWNGLSLSWFDYRFPLKSLHGESHVE